MNKNISLSSLSVFVVLLLSACSSNAINPPAPPPPPPPVDATVAASVEESHVTFQIAFDGDCPSTSNVSASINAKAADFINFESVPAGKAFTLTFDPFVGRVYKAPQGKVQARVSSQSLPDSAGSTTQMPFKFTIYSPNCTPIDPRIIITN